MARARTGRKTLLAVLVATFLLLAGRGLWAADPVAGDLVWTGTDGGQQQVFYCQYRDGRWLKVEQVSNDYLDNLHPVVDRDSAGNRWVFWTGIGDTGLSIRFALGREGQWSEAETLPSPLRTNIAPSVFVDAADTVHVVWAGNDGGLDDIYHAELRGEKWKGPERIHPENDVPDILPTIDTDSGGRLQVTWKRFQDGRYRLVRSIRTDDGWLAPVAVTGEEIGEKIEKKQRAPEPPEFVGGAEWVFLKVY